MTEHNPQALDALQAAIHDVRPSPEAAQAILDNLAELGWTVAPATVLQSAIDQATADLPSCCTGEDGSECCPTPTPSTILDDAQAAVYGDREGDYGHPREDFTRTAIIWTGLLQHKLADGAYIEAEDIPRCMIGVKLSRDVHAPKRDNRVDGAGYFLTLDRLETGR